MSTVGNPVGAVILKAGDAGDDASIERCGVHSVVAISAASRQTGLRYILIHGLKAVALASRKIDRKINGIAAAAYDLSHRLHNSGTIASSMSQIKQGHRSAPVLAVPCLPPLSPEAWAGPDQRSIRETLRSAAAACRRPMPPHAPLPTRSGGRGRYGQGLPTRRQIPWQRRLPKPVRTRWRQ